MTTPAGIVVAVSRSAVHALAKHSEPEIRLLAGLGVQGDAHMGETVQHRSRVARDPTQPNLRQVYLIHAELFEELRAGGFDVSAGQIGENVTTRGVDLLALPAGARLRLGSSAIVEMTGLRNPCAQLDDFRPGLMKALMHGEGPLRSKAGVMGIVLASGDVRPGDSIAIDVPNGPRLALDRV